MFFNCSYLKCSKSYCTGTAKIIDMDLNNIQVSRAHVPHCDPVPDAIIIAQFRDALKASLRNNYSPLKRLYDSMLLV